MVTFWPTSLAPGLHNGHRTAAAHPRAERVERFGGVPVEVAGEPVHHLLHPVVPDPEADRLGHAVQRDVLATGDLGDLVLSDPAGQPLEDVLLLVGHEGERGVRELRAGQPVSNQQVLETAEGHLHPDQARTRPARLPSAVSSIGSETVTGGVPMAPAPRCCGRPAPRTPSRR